MPPASLPRPPPATRSGGDRCPRSTPSDRVKSGPNGRHGAACIRVDQGGVARVFERAAGASEATDGESQRTRRERRPGGPTRPSSEKSRATPTHAGRRLTKKTHSKAKCQGNHGAEQDCHPGQRYDCTGFRCQLASAIRASKHVVQCAFDNESGRGRAKKISPSTKRFLEASQTWHGPWQRLPSRRREGSAGRGPFADRP